MMVSSKECGDKSITDDEMAPKVLITLGRCMKMKIHIYDSVARNQRLPIMDCGLYQEREFRISICIDSVLCNGLTYAVAF